MISIVMGTKHIPISLESKILYPLKGSKSWKFKMLKGKAKDFKQQIKLEI